MANTTNTPPAVPTNSIKEDKTTNPRKQFFEDLKSHPRKWENLSAPPRRMIYKVPPQLRMSQTSSERHLYDPIMVSLGPYHHGKEALSQAEEFKHLCLHWCAGGNDLNKPRFYNRILNRIDEIRDCYADTLAVANFNDKKLAMMMLLDSCFILNFMENNTGKASNNWHSFLGVAAAIPFAARDIMVLENQIPFFVLKMLVEAKYDEKESRHLLQKFLGWMLSVDVEQAVVPKEIADPPLHILEAAWRVVADETELEKLKSSHEPCCGSWWPKLLAPKNEDAGSGSSLPLTNKNPKNFHTCPSVTDLKAKGIFFKPSSSHSIKDIKFKSYIAFGQLQLPVRYLSDQTQVILSNMIAYEVSPDTKTNLAVLSYTNIMKSLVETPDDVKELQQKGIFQFNRFSNLKQVVQLFKSIDTFGLENVSIYEDVMQRVGDHCNSKGKTWIAELVHSKLKSPWTIIGLLAAIFLVVLTFLQTYYTMNPMNP